MVNKVILVGNLGRDPEVRTTPSGQAVANFSLATSRKWRDRDGNRQEQTEWHNLVVWGRQAEVAAQYLTKGRQIFVEGRLQTRSWDDRETGQKRRERASRHEVSSHVFAPHFKCSPPRIAGSTRPARAA